MSTQAPKDHIEHVVTVAEVIFGEHDRANEWLSQPLASFWDKTPLQLIDEGRTDSVVRYLESIQSGFVG